MRWITFFILLVIVSVLVIVFIGKNKSINKEPVVQPSISTAIVTSPPVENFPVSPAEIVTPYNFINVDKIGKNCLNLLFRKDYLKFKEKIEKNECGDGQLTEVEKSVWQLVAYKNLNKTTQEIEMLVNLIKKYKSEEMVNNNIETLLCTLIEKGEQNNSFPLVKEYIFENKSFKCFTKELLIKVGDYFYTNNEEFSARRIYSKVFFLANPEQRKDLIKKIEELNKKIIYSPAIYPDSFTYTVVKGDTLAKIGKQFSITPELIKKINKLSSNLIHPGKELKILKTIGEKKFKIIAKKSLNKLYLIWGDDIVKEYLISLGNPDVSPTPEGKFTIVSRLIYPAWKGIPYGAPENILGTRWLGFNEPFNNYGIHGTTQPETIGKNVTNGCIRMLNEDVEELFDFITEGVEVVVEK